MSQRIRKIITRVLLKEPQKYVAVDWWSGESESCKTKKEVADFLKNDVAKSERGNFKVYKIEEIKL